MKGNGSPKEKQQATEEDITEQDTLVAPMEEEYGPWTLVTRKKNYSTKNNKKQTPLNFKEMDTISHPKLPLLESIPN